MQKFEISNHTRHDNPAVGNPLLHRHERKTQIASYDRASFHYYTIQAKRGELTRTRTAAEFGRGELDSLVDELDAVKEALEWCQEVCSAIRAAVARVTTIAGAE